MLCGIAAQFLWGVLYYDRRSLNAKVRGATRLGRAAPSKPGIRKVGLDLDHFFGGRGVMNDSRPLGDKIQKHLLLVVGQGGSFDPLWLDGFTVVAGTQNEV